MEDKLLIIWDYLWNISKPLKGNKGKSKWCAIKVDMSKAFDKVEWGYLFQIMICLGFSKHWCNLVRKCITITTLSTLINGFNTGKFSPSWVVRQGDPLSPYLFILVAEELSRMLKKAEEEGNLKGIKVARVAPSISHLMFADDTLIFAEHNWLISNVCWKYSSNTRELPGKKLIFASHLS